MGATSIAAVLFQVQQIDLELERLIAEQQSVAQSLQGNTQLQQQRADYKSAQQQLQNGLQAQKEAEWTFEDLSRRLNVQEQRLYSGAVRNPKELQAAQQEIQRLRDQRTRQEDKTLEIMEEAEALQEMVRHKSEMLARAEEAWRKESAALVIRRDQLAERKLELESKRERLTASIDAEVMRRYAAMLRSKQGRAVSKVEQNSCQWCRVILTPSELQRVRVSMELQTCTNCGRILYYDR
ncbi:MAG: C4-type zinc ribbon domain-containing protein [Ktedonobacteraceae bacterium]